MNELGDLVTYLARESNALQRGVDSGWVLVGLDHSQLAADCVKGSRKVNIDTSKGQPLLASKRRMELGDQSSGSGPASSDCGDWVSETAQG